MSRVFYVRQVCKQKEVNSLATVTLREGESQESLLKRFRKSAMHERILSEVRRNR